MPQALSHDEASELTRVKQESALKDQAASLTRPALSSHLMMFHEVNDLRSQVTSPRNGCAQELKRLKQKLQQLDDQNKVRSEAAASSDARLATAHAERDNAKRSMAKLQEELRQKANDVAQLEKHGAFLCPQSPQRGLAYVHLSELWTGIVQWHCSWATPVSRHKIWSGRYSSCEMPIPRSKTRRFCRLWGCRCRQFLHYHHNLVGKHNRPLPAPTHLADRLVVHSGHRPRVPGTPATR